MKLILKRRLWATSLLLASVAASAAEQAYQMVVIAEDPLATLINANNIDPAAVTQLPASATDRFARQMNLCVLYSKQQRWSEANVACHQAVTSGRDGKLQGVASQRELRSYAYSNRGVAKSLTGDHLGALADFQRADALADHAVISHNLEKLTARLNQPLVTAMNAPAAAPK